MSSANRITRIHAPYVSENERENVNNFLRTQGEPDYVNAVVKWQIILSIINVINLIKWLTMITIYLQRF